MHISKTIVSNTVILELVGKLDNNGSEIFEKYINSMIEDSKGLKLLLDFEHVEYMSSSGLRVLMIVLKKLETRSGSLVLCSVNKFILDVFNMSLFDKMISIKSNREDALDFLSQIYKESNSTK